MKRAFSFKKYFLLDINPVIRLLIMSDAIWVSALGLLGPIFALFVVDFIDGGNVVVAGTAASIYLITRSILQIPVATIIDKIRGEKDDYWLLVGGSLVATLLPILYLFISTPMQLYGVQFLLGLATAVTFPSYMAIFTRHIDKNREGTEWGIYFTITDLGAAAAASIGGVVASSAGFHQLIIILVAISFTGALVLIPLKKYLKLK
jgi:MFS family permease